MADERRITPALIRVAEQLMTDPNDKHYGYRLMKTARVGSGTMYKMFDRMVHDGWLTDHWELDGHAKPRRYYELTTQGKIDLGAILAHSTGWRAVIA